MTLRSRQHGSTLAREPAGWIEGGSLLRPGRRISFLDEAMANAIGITVLIHGVVVECTSVLID